MFLALRCSLLFILCSTLLLAQSEAPQHSIFSKKDGLAIDKINTLAFDNDGFIWMGGLNLHSRKIISNDEKVVIQRFDGANFHNIVLPTADRIVEVHHISKRDDGLFYINVSTEGLPILYLFDPYSLLFSKIELGLTDKKRSSISQPYFYKGKTYILTQQDRTITVNQLNHALTVTKLFHFTSSENKFALDRSTVFIPDEQGVIIGDDNFPIMFFSWEGVLLKRYAHDSFSRERDIFVDKFYINEQFESKDTLYAFIENRKELFFLNRKKKAFTPLRKKALFIEDGFRQVVTDTKGAHLVVTNQKGRLNFLTKKGDAFENKFELAGFDHFPNYTLHSQDVTKGVWVGTSDRELHYIKFPSEVVTTYLENSGLRTIKAVDSVNFIIATDAEGWFMLNTDTQVITPYNLTENGNTFLPKYTRNIIDDGDYYWSNSFGSILHIDKETKASRAFRHYPVNCMVKNTDTTILYGTSGYHLMEFNIRTEKHQSLIKTDTLDIYGISIGPDSQLAVLGTSKGIMTYDLETNKIKTVPAHLLEDAFILMTMYDEELGHLLGTRDGKLLQLEPETMTLNELYRDELSAGIATVIFSDDGMWWINTFNGIVAFDPDQQTTTRFSIKDGLSHFETNRHSALKTPNGFFIGTIKGLNFFNPSLLKPDISATALVPLRIRYYDKTKKGYVDSMDRSAFAKAETITLPAENRLLEIDFSVTGLDVNRNETYRYRLNEGAWIDIKNSKQLKFPNLSAGTYDLEIAAIDYSGNKVGEPLRLSINALNFFYKTWWFYLLVSVISIGFLLWLLHQNSLKAKMQERFTRGLLASQEEERNRIAKELHDSVGQQLTLIKQYAQKTTNHEIAKLTSNTLDEVRSISRGLYPALLKQLGLTGSIEQLLLEVDEQTGLFVSIEIDDIDPYFNEEQSLHLYRFIQECVANVIKHANAKTMAVVIENHQSFVKAEIRDNGKGFPAQELLKKNSLGLKTLEERIKILKGTLDITSSPQAGTITSAEIPLLL